VERAEKKLYKEIAIEVRSRMKKYGDLTAADGISFTIHKGEVFAFVSSMVLEKPQL